MAQVLSLSFNLGGELKPSLSNAFKRAEGLMDELQDKNSALNKNLSQVNNYSKLEAGLKADKNALAELSAQSVKVKSDLQAASVQVSSLKSQVKTANSEFISSQASLALSREKYAAITEEVAKLKHEMAVAPSDALRKQLSAAELEAVKLKNAMAKDEAQFKTADAKLKVLNKDLKTAEGHEKSLSRESQNLAAKTESVQKSLNNKNSALEKLHGSLTQAGIDTRNLASEQARLARQSEQVARAQRNLESARARWSAARENLSFSNLSGDFMQAVAGFNIIKKPLKVAADYEAQMARVNAVVFGGVADRKKSQEQLKQLQALKDQAKNLGATTQYTSIEAGATQEVLARAGFKPQEIIDMMPAVMNMAAAEGMELAEAASILAGVGRGFGKTAKDAAHVADVLAKGSASADTSISELGEAMRVVAPVSSQLGMSLEETTVLLDLLADKQIKASQAGTGLSGMLLRMTKQPKEFADAMAKFKIPVFDKDGNLRDLIGLFKELDEKTKKLGDGERMGIMASAFGLENAKIALNIMDAAVAVDKETGKTGAESKTEAIKQAAGTAKNMADVINDTFKGDLTILESNVEGFMNEVSGNLLSAGRWLSQQASDVVGGVTGFLQEHKAASQAVSYGAAAVGALGVAKFGAKLFTSLKDFASAGIALKKASTAAQAVNAVAAGSSAAAGSAAAGAASAAGSAAAGAGTGASAVTAGTAGFSLAKFLPALGIAVSGVSWVVEQGKKEMAARENYAAQNADSLKKFVELAERNNLNLDEKFIAYNLDKLNKYASGETLPNSTAFNMEYQGVQALIKALFAEREKAKSLPSGHGENLAQQKLLEQRAEVVRAQAQANKLELPQAWAKRDDYKGWQDVKLDEQGTELINRAAEIKDLKIQEQPVMAENKAKIAEITQLITQVPPNMTELVSSMRSAEQAVRDLPQNLAPYLEQLKNSQPVIINNSQSMSSPQVLQNSRFMSGGGFAAHAKGGIFNTPHFGLVAEAGMEAVIPLEDKSRGVPLWLAAGEEMGLDFASAGMINNSSSSSPVSNLNKPSYNFNITVNAPQDSQAGHGENLELVIRRAIDNALRDIAEREAMVSFA